MKPAKAPRKQKSTWQTQQDWRPATAVKTREVDRENGLVYDEVAVKAIKANTTWMVDPRTPNIGRRIPQRNTGDGSRTLLDTALAKICLESRDLTSDTLCYLPWSLGLRVWELLQERHLESFHLWHTFAAAYPDQFSDRGHRYFMDLKPTLPLEDYFKAINSTAFGTCLRLPPKQTAVRDMVAVHKITNLTALDLSDGQLYMDLSVSTFDAQLVRTWVDLAKSGRAFQHLEILLLGWQDLVGFWIFDALKWFPKLRLLVMTDCHQIHHKNHKDWQGDAYRNGWEFMPSKRGVKWLRPFLGEAEFQVGGISGLLYEETQKEPVLEVWLGAPKPWMHIIDDFPGTKTVVLQRKVSEVGARVSSFVEAGEKRYPSSPKAGDRNRKWTKAQDRKMKTGNMDVGSLLAQFSQ